MVGVDVTPVWEASEDVLASLWQRLTGVFFSTPPTPVRLQKEEKKNREDLFRQENI